MPRFKSSLDDARRSGEADYQRTLKAVGSRGAQGPLDILANNGTAAARIESQSRQRVFDAREQLRHFRNQVFTSIRPIAQRIAGQPIRLALIAAAPKSRQNRLTETRQCELPRWLKSMALGMKANEDLKIVDQHAILDAINHPAPSLPGWNDWSLKYMTVASMELTGYAYWWLVDVGGRKEIWNLPSHWVRPRHSAAKLFVGWDLLPDGVEEPIPLELDDIAPFWYPDPSNPIQGLGPLEAGAKSIMVEEFVIEAQKRSFQLGIHPSALITAGSQKIKDGKPIPPRLKQFQRQQVIDAINARYRGMLHYGEPMILDALISGVEPYGNKPSEMDFGTNADSARARVEQCFGTNPYTAGAAGLSSRAESAESDRHFVSNTVNPKVELISRVLTIMVLPQFDATGRYVLFIEPARPNDAEMESKDWDQALKYGTATVNEHRTHVLRLPPIPGGDVALVPQTMQYAKIGDTIAKPLASGGTIAPSDPVEQTSGTDAEDPDAADEQQAEGQEADKAVRLRLANKAFDDAFYDSYAQAWLKSHGDQESSMQDAILKFFADQGADVAAKLEAALGDDSAVSKSVSLARKDATDGILPHVFEPAHWVQKFKDAIKPAFAKALAAGATHELEQFSDFGQKSKVTDSEPTTGKVQLGANSRFTWPGGVLQGHKADGLALAFDFGVDLPPAVLSGIETALTDVLSKDYWADIQQTTKDSLAKSLKDGLAAGEDMRSIVKRVKNDVFGGDVAKARAENIARTEATNALGAGQHEARLELADQGVIDGKEWFATYDGVTRNTHLSADGQQRGVDEPFEVGGYQARWPGDQNLPAKERCRCRCTASSVTAMSTRTRAPQVKSFVSSAGCEVHGQHHSNQG